jgi:hypothetical protein
MCRRIHFDRELWDLILQMWLLQLMSPWLDRQDDKLRE